jgi:pimeloyl-ACP methyl ester carboxylesterase
VEVRRPARSPPIYEQPGREAAILPFVALSLAARQPAGTETRLPPVNELLGLAQLLLLAVVVAVVIASLVIARDAVRPPRRTAGYAVARGLPADPGDLSLAFEAWTLQHPDGAALPVWEIAGRAPADSGPNRITAVFVHDWAESRIDVLSRLEPWDGLCGRLVLYDLRGHGDAEGGVSRLGRREAQDLGELLARLGGGPYVLIGRAMGAGIAIAAAATAPAGTVAGVVTEGPPVGFGESLRDRLRAAALPARPLAGLALAWLWLAGVLRGGPEPAEPPEGLPVLAVGPSGTVTGSEARAFLARCAAQPASFASASSSGPR